MHLKAMLWNSIQWMTLDYSLVPRVARRQKKNKAKPVKNMIFHPEIKRKIWYIIYL